MVIVLSCSKKLQCTSSTTDVDFRILQFVHNSSTFLPVPNKIDKLVYSTTYLAKQFIATNWMKNLWKFCCNIEFLYFFNTAFWQNFKSHFDDLNIHKWFIHWIDEILKNQKLKCWVFTNNSLILVKLFKKKPKY